MRYIGVEEEEESYPRTKQSIILTRFIMVRRVRETLAVILSNSPGKREESFASYVRAIVLSSLRYQFAFIDVIIYPPRCIIIKHKRVSAAILRNFLFHTARAAVPIIILISI